ncbi:MAG: nucleotidyl transferase AbiEii/AbiGii toxin family protein [Armatimonadetes bacterium]|nr:nucleotidyl transferase AbiEii/AbiGii toxin family protein [Armatimonadota bacterium]
MSPNTAQSVSRRLLNHSKATGRAHGELLHHFLLERFLYRLGQSRFRDRFVLKGALLLHLWQEVPARFTRDIDLRGSLPSDPETVAAAIREVCRTEAPDDGATFEPDSVVADRIVTDGAYEGVRVRFLGFLGTARVRMQIDIGFGDPVVPCPAEASYPVLLGHPPPALLTYTRESALAEKLSVMLRLGRDNSRMKDYYDVWLLSQSGGFAGATLLEAARQCFVARGLEPAADPAGVSSEFGRSPDKVAQWAGFVRRTRAADAPADLDEVVTAVREFMGPVLKAVAAGEPFAAMWHPPGPWQAT